MAQITLLVCDRCDQRDRTDDGSVAYHKICLVQIGYLTDGVPEPFDDKHLCEKCRENLHSVILHAITQIPQERPTSA